MKIVIFLVVALSSFSSFSKNVETVKGIQISSIQLKPIGFVDKEILIEEYKIIKNNTRSCFRKTGLSDFSSIDCAFFDHLKESK